MDYPSLMIGQRMTEENRFFSKRPVEKPPFQANLPGIFWAI